MHCCTQVSNNNKSAHVSINCNVPANVKRNTGAHKYVRANVTQRIFHKWLLLSVAQHILFGDYESA